MLVQGTLVLVCMGKDRMVVKVPLVVMMVKWSNGDGDGGGDSGGDGDDDGDDGGDGDCIGDGDGFSSGYATKNVDYDHCFFHDPDQPAPSESLNLEHRKIVYLKSLFNQESAGDYEEGHGTHTVSCDKCSFDPKKRH